MTLLFSPVEDTFRIISFSHNLALNWYKMHGLVMSR